MKTCKARVLCCVVAAFVLGISVTNAPLAYGQATPAATVAPQASPAVAATPISTDARETQISGVVNGLNSLDPATRLATFEGAMAGADSTLRRVALSTAFASSDADLRSIALDKAIASVTTFVVQITSNGASVCTGGNCTSTSFQNGLGSDFEVRMVHFDPSLGTFDGWSAFSGREETLASQQARSNYSVYPVPPAVYDTLMRAGSVAGGRLSFEVDASGLVGWHGSFGAVQAHCSGVARLQGGDAVLKGSMTCSARDQYGFSDTENFSIEINVLG